MTKNIAIVGNPASGKTAFIQAARSQPISSQYFKTIACEAHPHSHNGEHITLWEFGHYCNWDIMENMDGVIYITTRDSDFVTNKPHVVVMNKNKKAKFDTNAVLNEIMSKL